MCVNSEILTKSIDAIENTVVRLKDRFLPPTFVTLSEGIPAFRHASQDDLLMSYLKCVRSVSLLRAGMLMLSGGFYQEVGILCRCLAESFEDVMFLATPLGDEAKPSKKQIQMVGEFFQEEFEDPSRPLGSQNRRERVPRDDVLAGIARIQGNPLNASDAKMVYRQSHMTFSGYVHGAYPHVMELFGAKPDKNGNPDVADGEYYMHGRVPPQQLGAMVNSFANRTHDVAIAVCTVAKRLGEFALSDALMPAIEQIAHATGSIRIVNPNQAIKNIKLGKPLES